MLKPVRGGSLRGGCQAAYVEVIRYPPTTLRLVSHDSYHRAYDMSWGPFASRVPPYPTAVEQVLAHYDDAAKRRRGRIVFLAGDAGASRGALDAVRDALVAMSPPPLLLEGDLRGNKYVP